MTDNMISRNIEEMEAAGRMVKALAIGFTLSLPFWIGVAWLIWL